MVSSRDEAERQIGLYPGAALGRVHQIRPGIAPAAAASAHPKGRALLARHLAVMDTTATSLSMDNPIPVQVFALKDPQNILRVVMGEPIGTIVKEEL